MSNSPVAIGVAVVEDEDQFLVGVRPDGTDLAGCAEFPGGKRLPGESSAECAVRECREETGLQVRAVQLLLEREHRYPHAVVRLSFWRCLLEDRAARAAEHQGFRWVDRRDLPRLDFPAANAPLIELLVQAVPPGE